MSRPEQAELSTLATSVSELTDRVTALAEHLGRSDDAAEVAAALFEAERSLRMAGRNLERALRAGR